MMSMKTYVRWGNWRLDKKMSKTMIDEEDETEDNSEHEENGYF